MSTDRKQTVRQAWEAAWDRGDFTALAALVAPTYRRHSSRAKDGEGQTREEFEAVISSTRLAFPDLHTEILDLVEDGDVLAIRWRSTGTHTGRLMGVPPTGRSVEVTGANFARFDGEAIVEEYVSWDPREFLEAIGVIHLSSSEPTAAS
jgi:steroid delta-isomerase-like uncharacterized protein